MIERTSPAAEDPAPLAVRVIAEAPSLPTGQLLRPAGGGGLSLLRPSRRRAMRILAAEAARVLETGRADHPPAWSTRAFASRVQVARRQLAPISGIVCLADSFRREATHIAGGGVTGEGARVGPASQALRVAYAIRWVEITTGVVFPAWQACTGPRAARS